MTQEEQIIESETRLLNAMKASDINALDELLHADLIFNIPFLVSYVSQFMTLLPGDIISTGTPAGVGLGFNPPIYLQPGDVMELGIEGLGTAKQTCVAYN